MVGAHRGECMWQEPTRTWRGDEDSIMMTLVTTITTVITEANRGKTPVSVIRRSKHFTWILLLILKNASRRWAYGHFTDEDAGAQRSNNLPKATMTK